MLPTFEGKAKFTGTCDDCGQERVVLYMVRGLGKNEYSYICLDCLDEARREFPSLREKQHD